MTWAYNIALKTSKKSLHDKHKMAAVIIQGGRVVSLAPNGKSIWHGGQKSSRHAECRAIGQNHFKDATLIVARSNGSRSAPCPNCLRRIINAGISRVVYADWDGRLIIEKVK